MYPNDKAGANWLGRRIAGFRFSRLDERNEIPCKARIAHTQAHAAYLT